MNPVGIAAALATAVSWAACAMFFTSASRRIGVFAMNNWRVLIGALLLVAAHWIAFGTPVPAATGRQWIMLLASGLLGVFIGDTFFYQSLHDIGPRRGLLLYNVSPFMTAFIAWPILGEELRLGAWVGIAVTVGGASWVLAEEHRSEPGVRSPHWARGIACGLLAAGSCALGYIVAKPALAGPNAVAPLGAALIRVIAAVAGFWTTALLRGRVGAVAKSIRNRRTFGYLVGGSITGPSLGIWLSMMAIALVPTGVATTLFATMPVVILPMVILFYRERVSWRAAIGAALATAGVAILVNA